MVFKVDNVDFSDCIAVSGFGWEKNDIEEDDAGRDDAYTMHRAIGAKKRKTPWKCRDRLPFARAQALGLALDKDTVSITYKDLLLGQTSKTFYGTKISASSIYPIGTDDFVDGLSFELVEV